MENGSSIQSVTRIFSILEYLSQHGQSGVTEISSGVSLSKGTVHRMLCTLCELGYISKNSNDKYFMTVKFLRLSSSLLHFWDIRAQVRPFLEKLSQQTGETVHFVKREGNSIVYIDKVESTANSLQMVSRIGLTHPLYRTGVGKAILAQMENEEIERIWHSSDIIAKTDKTITKLSDFLMEAELIRERGYAIDDEENELGVKCIALAVADENGKYEYAFSISAPVYRMTPERIEELSKLALKIKEKL